MFKLVIVYRMCLTSIQYNLQFINNMFSKRVHTFYFKKSRKDHAAQIFDDAISRIYIYILMFICTYSTLSSLSCDTS